MNWKGFLVAIAAMLFSTVASAAAITPDEFFTHVENEYPGFAKGQSTHVIDFQGCVYDYRQYGGDYYLGVCRTNGGIYSYTGGVLRDVNGLKLDDFKCKVKPKLCGAAGYGGDVILSQEVDGTYATFRPNYVNGKLTWLGADGKGVDIPSGDVEAICARSLRLGNWGKKAGFGCAAPQANGELRIRIPNNDCSRFVAWQKSTGKEAWFNLEDAKGWQVTGLNAKANSACGVEYGHHGFTPAKIHVVHEADGTASLVWDFGSDYVNGFFGRDGQAVAVGHLNRPYAFVLNGSRQGKDYDHGWGLGSGRKASSGDEIQPSIRMAWLEFADGRYFIKFRNLACSDRVNITVYQGSGPANDVRYDFGTDGFGLGWAGLPFQNNQSMWTGGNGVAFDRDKGQVHYGVPFCKQK